MWPTEGLGTCEGSKRGYHIFFKTMMMSQDRKHWLKACRYCDVVQQISLVPQADKNYPKIVTEMIRPRLEKSNEKSDQPNVPCGTIDPETGEIGPIGTK